MDIEIIREEENPMLHRTDVRFELTHDEATPSRLSVRDSLAARLNKDAGEVVVHELDTKFGMRKTLGYAKVYDSADDAREVEQTYMLERNKIGVDEEDDDEASAEAEEA
ncbi:30S ribosomal protein S24e [Halococcus sp. AFM35]|uniref:30S ribosomal protein S24e n=1 Tax=Halococcus sp. AFM35 TaxID=3421653 RepID=UPI003EBE99D8